MEQLKIVITAEISKLKNNINDGKRLIDRFGDESQSAMQQVSGAMQGAGDVSKKVLAVMSGAILGATAALFIIHTLSFLIP